jgi:hypothetical protein
MSQVCIGSASKRLAKTVQGEKGNAQERNQNHKKGNADQLGPDFPIAEEGYKHISSH